MSLHNFLIRHGRLVLQNSQLVVCQGILPYLTILSFLSLRISIGDIIHELVGGMLKLTASNNVSGMHLL